MVVVAEQLGSGPFNRGALLNFAFLAMPASVTAVAVVDVDLLPLPSVNFSDVGCALDPSCTISMMTAMSSQLHRGRLCMPAVAQCVVSA